MLNKASTTAAGLVPPPRAASASPAMEQRPRPPHCIPCPFPLPPPSIHRVKCQLRASHFIPINASHSSALITGHRNPPQPLYKGRAPSFSIAPLPALLLFSPCPSTARTEGLLHRLFTTIAWPPHCRHRPGEARDGLPVHPSPHCMPPPVGRRASERPLGRALLRSVAGQGGRSTVDHALRWSMSHGLSPQRFPIEK
jgi:hypothetical protein